MQKIEKNSGPRTSIFLDSKSTSAAETGGEKGDQTKASPKSCVPLFFSRKVAVPTTPARENSGTHDFGDSIVWSPFRPPVSVAEVDFQSRKQMVLGPLFFSIICMFEDIILDTFAFLEIRWGQSDLGRGEPFVEH